MKKKLGDVFEIGSGGTPSKTHPEYYGGDIPWVKTGDLKSEYLYEVEDFITEEGLNNSSAKMYESDTVLIAMYGATIGATSILNFPACTNQACAAFKKSEEILPEYLYFFLRSKKEKFVNDGVGGTQPNISAGYLKKVQIEVRSLDEQSEIINVLDKVNRIIDERTKELAALDDLIKARFVEMFGGLHNSKLYPYVSIETFTDVTSGGTPNRNTKEYWENGNIRWVKTTELHNNFITDTEEYITRKGIDNSSAKVIPAHSILVAMYGQGKTRGMTGYLLKECTTNQACACILPCKRVDQKYLWYYMILSYDKLRGMAKGGNQPNLNIGIIKRFQVLVPPIELQNQFADFVNQVYKSKLVIKNLLQIYKHQIQM